MRNVSAILLAGSVFALSGCIILFGPSDHDEVPTCTVICGQPKHCSASYCLSSVWGKRFTWSATQNLTDIDMAGWTIAMTGRYSDPFQLDDVPLPYSGTGPQAFGALIDGETTNVTWAKEMTALGDNQPRVGRGIAIFNDYFWLAGVYETTVPDQNLSLLQYTRNDNSLIGTFPMGQKYTDDIVAITSDDPDVYAIGTLLEDMDGKFPCNGTEIPYDSGMFVMKFNKAGSCSWFKSFAAQAIFPRAIGAATSSKNGVWLTGTFSSSISTGDPMTSLTPSSTDTEDAFLVGMTATGTVSLAQNLGPGVFPSAIAGGNGMIYVAGQLVGAKVTQATMIKSNVAKNQTAAFVAAFDTKALDKPTWVTVYPGSVVTDGGAKATAVSVDDTSVYVAGIFGYSIEIPVGNTSETFTQDGANPFLSRLHLGNGNTLAFHGFGGGGDLFGGHDPILMSNSPTGVVVAGSWEKTLDFTTSNGKAAKLEQPMQIGGQDVFLVRLDKQPPL